MKNPFRRRLQSAPDVSGAGRQVHLTFVHSRVGRSLSRTGNFFKTQLWVRPLIIIAVLSCLAYFLRGTLERTMRDSVRSQLETLLELETSMVTTWLKTQAANVEAHANNVHVRTLVYELLERQEEAPAAASQATLTALHGKLKKELMPTLSAHDYHSYLVLDKTGKILSSDNDAVIGRSDLTDHLTKLLPRILDGETVFVPPYPSRILMKDQLGRLRSGVPIMMMLAPIRDENFQGVAILGYRIRPEREFSPMLQQGRFGQTGETYVFNTEGRMVSNSRFDHELMLSGLLLDEPGSESILQIQLRDPGGNLLAGHRPQQRRAELPYTKPVAEALAGRNGVDVVGYRDYRGVETVGAWTFFPKHGMGLATEVDEDEAFRPLYILKWTFWGLFSLLSLAAIAIFVFSLRMSKLRREAQTAALETQKLGQYVLEEKLGSGGMGMVYKGRHAVLRRPTAIKMLQLDRITQSSIERFEREVQITCQLNHPNTVQIYDYGRTPEGLFYYAMEYLDGIDLQSLVQKYGPQPEGRVIRILLQVCGSLYEAHSLGLVHRDIKPANIMLNRRGGEPDVAKVLDFGLVKALDDEKHSSLTAAGSLTGTPLYMSPEAIQSPNSIDARSDLYALGAVGYFLLTGQPVFEAAGIVELCHKHVDETPATPSERIGRQISIELEAAILACLEKSRAKRPQTARDLAALLLRSAAANSWSIDEADVWWSRHERGLAKGTSPAVADVTLPPTTPPANATERTYVVDQGTE